MKVRGAKHARAAESLIAFGSSPAADAPTVRRTLVTTEGPVAAATHKIGVLSMKGIVLALLVMLVPTAVVSTELSDGGKPAARGSDEAQIELIKKLERDRLEAGVRKDVDAISVATAEDYMQIDSDGNILDKAATLQRIRSSYARLQANPVDDIVVRLYGNVAILTARATPKGTIDGKSALPPIRYTRVYVRRDDRWQVVLFQQTRQVTQPRASSVRGARESREQDR
jgi:ketosteroid isomerase-like protein